MDRHRIFANNLTAIQRLRQMSAAEFAKEIGVPPSTWQAVLKDRNTTLNTALPLEFWCNFGVITVQKITV